MKQPQRKSLLISGIVALSMLLIPAFSSADSTSSADTGQQKCNLTNIQSRGAAEITRRLNTLNTLQSKISAAKHLTSGDQSALSLEVTGELGGLSTLQTTLANDQTCADARSDAKSIYSEYRVYALVVPKVQIIKAADDQQVTEGKLTTLAGKLQIRITADQLKSLNVTTLQTELNDMTTQTNNAQALSSSVEAAVLTLQPSDYNADHTILSTYYTELKTAHSDIVAARADAKNIISGLKSLE